VTGFVSHQFHEPLRCSPFDFEHHRPLQRAQPVVNEKKWNEDRRYADGDEPFIADVTWRMKHQFLCRKFVVQLSGERLKRRALQPQSER
jgi:hypothetical protein